MKTVRKSEYLASANNLEFRNTQVSNNHFQGHYVYNENRYEDNNFFFKPIEKIKPIEPKGDVLLSRKRLESSIAEMKARFMEIKAFTCNCNYFRLNMESDLIRMFKRAAFA